MGMKVAVVDVWAASIKDRAGGLAEKLAILAKAGAQIEFVVARRAPEKPGTGVVFLTPLKGARQAAAAKKAGFRKTHSLRGVRVTGADRPGIGGKLTGALAEHRISLRGLSAAVIGKQFVAHFAFDRASDVAKAAKILKKL
jgi:UTP:GlnB (protein PII) uridylyltransferase